MRLGSLINLNKLSQNNISKEVTCECDCVEGITQSIPLPYEFNRTYMESNNLYTVQSADVADGVNELTSEVVTFVDNSTGDVEDLGFTPSSLISSSSTLNTDLHKFLSRPTKINTLTWTTSDLVGIQQTLEPWFLFLDNLTIKNKIQNYAFVRGKLCLKFVVNATPFHYGLYRVAYEPSVNFDNTGYRKSKIRPGVTGSNSRLVPFSQLPGNWILPSDNSGGTLMVPYFRHTDWLNLNSAADIKSMGTLTYYLAEPLRVASAGGSTSITIETYAWMEDVELNGSTAQLAVQARDEYDGVISKPASAISGIASRLSSVPVIGKFARATEIGASAIAGIASIFGFTNVPNISEVHGMVPFGAPHLASSEISTPVQKLTLDPKQELSVDPSMHGVPSEDQMAIPNLVKIKSAITIFPWSTAAAIDTVLWNTKVSPAISCIDSIVDASSTLRAYRAYHTPMSYLNMAFAHWRGDICFEFTVICTKFHKGRLQFSWDPLGATGTTSIDENKVFTTVLDIGETNKAILRVPYHQAFAFLRTRDATQGTWTNGLANTVDLKQDNGLLLVSVLTPLISPVSPQSIGVMVSVYGAENFEFANPRQCLGRNEGSAPPTFFAVQAKDEIDITPVEITFGDNGVSHPERYKQNMGQAIASLRTLLHRYSIYDTSMVGPSSATRCVYYSKSYTRLPPMFGFDPNGQSTAFNTFSTGGIGNINFVPTHPITYFSMMYGGFSGGVNYAVNVSHDLTPSLGEVRVQRYNITTEQSFRLGAANGAVSTTNSKNSSLRSYNLNILSNCTGGAALTNTMTNGTLNWMAPMMLPTNFCYPDTTFSMTGNSSDGTDRECSFLTAFVKQTTANTTSNQVSFTTYAGTAPDYNLIWFLCCPTLDYYLQVPNSDLA